ncbi:Endopeptidase S2P [Psidium guajava]|nr:Endopeptidase S2P [Psidium guajava]
MLDLNLGIALADSVTRSRAPGSSLPRFSMSRPPTTPLSRQRHFCYDSSLISGIGSHYAGKSKPVAVSDGEDEVDDAWTIQLFPPAAAVDSCRRLSRLSVIAPAR